MTDHGGSFEDSQETEKNEIIFRLDLTVPAKDKEEPGLMWDQSADRKLDWFFSEE